MHIVPCGKFHRIGGAPPELFSNIKYDAPEELIGFKAICIPLVGEVFVFPILQSPPDMALNFRTCQLHTAWELLHENGGNERQAAWHGQLHWQGRQHPGKY